MKSFIVSIILLSLFAVIVNHAHAEKINVIVSITPLADFVKQVGGERVDVKVLMPPGASPHTYEPTPKAVKEVTDAQVFVKIGAGLEFWAEKIIKAAGNKKLIIVDSSEGVSLMGETHPHAHNNCHSHGQLVADPHIWLDPMIARDIVTKIEQALIKIDTANSDFYKKNASRYRTELSQLDKDISEKVKTFRIKEYVTFHPAWNYFSKRYGIKVAAVIEESPGKEPSPKHIARIVNEINNSGIKVIFAEPQFSPKIAEAIARECNAKVLYLDPIGGQKGRDTYIDMMKYNISVMESVMK